MRRCGDGICLLLTQRHFFRRDLIAFITSTTHTILGVVVLEDVAGEGRIGREDGMIDWMTHRHQL